MATRSSSSVDDTTVTLPAAVPLEIPRTTRLSWELGSRIVDGAESTLRSAWENTSSLWELTVFRATSATVILKVCTPVGRERFYGAANADFEAAVSSLETAPSWRRIA
nr:hypothetical protein [Natronococcus sp. AD5]